MRRFVHNLQVGEEFLTSSTLVRYRLVEKRTVGKASWYFCQRIDTGAIERLAHNRVVIKAEAQYA